MALKYFQDQKFRKKDGKPYGYKGIDAYQNSQARADYSMRSDDEEDDFELAELRKARNDASMQRLINSREYQDKQRQMRESAIELAKSKPNAGGDRITESRLSGITDYAKEHPLQVGATLAGSALKSGLERTTVGKAISLGVKGQELQKQASDYLTTGEKGETTEELLEAAKKRNAAYDENTKKLFNDLKAAKQEYATQYDSSGYAYEEEAARNKIIDIENQLKASGLTDKDIKQYEKDQDRINNAVAEEERKGRINEKLREGGKKGVANNVLYAAGDILSSTVSGFPAVANAIGAKIKGENVDTNSKAWTLANINKDIEEIQNDIIIESVDKQVGKKDSWQGQVAGYGYGVGMSTAKSLTAMGIGGSVAGAIGAEAGLSAEATTKLANAFTLPGFGANAAAESVREGQDRGLNSNQILATSLAAGFFEMFFEQFSLDHAWDIVKNNNPRVAKNMLVNLLVQGGIEGSEEGATDIANWIADYLINGKLSEYEQVLSETGSKRDTYLYFAKQLGLDMLAGFISGEVAGLGYSAANMHYQTKGGRAMFEDKEGMQDALENPQSPNYISPNEEDYESEEAYTQAIAARNELQKAVYNQKITGKQARSLFSDVQQAYANKDKQQKSEFQSQTKTEEVEGPETPAEEYQAPEKTQEDIISDIEFASTPYELAKALEYVEEETDEIKELVAFKRDELKMYGATDEELDNVITPKKAFEMGQKGEEITEDQLASIPQNDRQEVLESNNQQYNKAILAEHKDAITDTKTGKYFVPSEVKVKGNEIVVVDSEGHEHADFSSPKIKAANNAISVVSKDARTGNNTGQSLYNVTVKQSADVTELAIKSTEANSIQLNSAVKAIFQVASVGNRTWSAFENKYQYMFDVIDKNAAKTLFDQVRSDARISDRIKTKGTAGKRTSNETVSKTLRENLPEETVALLEAFGNKIGYNFVASTNKEARGDILPSKRQISIGQNNLSEVYAITSHEGIAEYLQAHGNEDEVLDIQDTMLSYLQDKMGEEQYQNLINLYQSVYRTGAKSEIDANKSRRAAANEMFADTVWTLFASEEGLNDFVGWVTDTKTASEQVSIFTKIKDFFSKIYNAIRDYIEHGSFNEAERAALEMDAKQAKELRDRIFVALDHAIENAKASEEINQEGNKSNSKKIAVEELVRNSFAGIKSATADLEAMNKARNLKDEGMDDSTILATTGWFLGMDNKWKYEIPDNDLEIFKSGNRSFVENNPDFARYQELVNKILFTDSDYTQEEYEEMQLLDKKVSDDEYYRTKQIGKLPDFIRHDELFKAYPWLEYTDVIFLDLPADTRGAAQTRDNTILLNERFQKEVSWNDDALKSTLMHEIQHLIQEQEQFASGSSPDWWADIRDERIQDDKQSIENIKAHLEKYVEKAKEEGKPSSTNEFVEQSVKKITDKSLDYTIEDHWKAVADWKAHSSIYHYENMISKLERHIDRLISDSDNVLYYNTAGEIEARDTANRLNYTKEDRLKNYPAQKQQEVVYPTGSVADRRFSKKVGDIEKAAIEHFGTTNDFKFAGYMLPDGQLLDFSGAHWLDGASEAEKEQFRQDNGMKQVDHDDIYEVMEASGDNRKQFMDRGNIRLNPEAPGFNISSKIEPTAAQYRELKEFIREVKRNPYYDASNFYVDIEDTHPNKISYANNLNEDRIINDIKKYYETGEMPQQSSLNDFRYSKKVLLPDGREVKYLADVLNPPEYNRLKKMIDSGYPAFNSSEGDAVYRLDNKLVYARGKENFGISRIVEANVNDDADATYILDWFADQEEKGATYEQQRIIAEDIFTEGSVNQYTNEMFGYVSRYDRPTKRGKSRSDAYYAQREQNRRRVFIKDEQLVDDIRKSIKVYGEASPYADSINETKTITALIGSMNNALSKADVFEVPNDELIRIERYINNKYKVEGIEEGEIAANVAYTFAYMQKNKLDTDYEVMMNYLLNIGDEVIKHSNLKDPETEKIYQDTRAQLMSHKIKLTDADRAEISNAFGGSWKEAFGALQKAGIRLDNKNGVSIDSIFSEIKQEVLESAGIDISYGDKPSEQILALIDTMTALEPTAYLWDGANDMDKALTVVTDIVQQYYTTATEQLESNVVKGTQKGKDALKKAVEKEKARLRGEWSKYKTTKSEEFNELVAEKNQVIQQQQNEIKRQNELLKTWKKDMAQKDKELSRRTTLSDKEIKATARLQAKQAVQSYKDRQERAKQIENIKKTGIRLIKWLTNPSDTQHVPQFLQKPLGEFLAAIDFLPKNPKADSKSTLSWHQRMNGLREELIRIKNSEDEGNNDVRAYFAQNIVAKELISMMDDFLGKEEWDEFTQSYILTKRKASKVSSLDAKDLATLNKIMSALSASINNLNKTYANDQFKEISKLAKESVKEVDSLPAKKDMQKLMGQVFNFLNFDELEPITYFEGLGKGAKSVFDELRAGFNLKTKHVRESDEYMAKAKEELGISDKELSTWKNQVHKFNLVEGTVMLNTTQIMSLYETLKRKQGKPHVAVGGIKAADFEYKDGKIMKKHHQAKAVHIMSSEAQAIIDTLTDEQKALADKMQQYMASECASWGNRVTEKMYGYKKYEEEDYFPLRTDAHSRATTASSDNNVSYYTIKNASFTKPITPMANNAVVLEDIFDVFTDHVVSMADYDAYVMPIADAMRWFNYSERMINAVAPDELNEQGARMDYIGNMQESIDRVYGDAGLNYFRQFIKDINGDYAGRGGKSEILNSMMSMYKAQAVGANVRVVIQQPTAVVRAADVIEAKYLLKALTTLPMAMKYAKKAQANSEIAYWKAQGYYETYLGQSFKEIITGDTTFKDRMNDLSGKLAGLADDLSWGIMYHAAELKVKKTMPQLKEGTAAFDAAATKIFEDIVDHTQVVDTIFHKSQWMRSQELGHKITSAFMAEPTKTYNMLYRAYRDVKIHKDKNALKKLNKVALIFVFEQMLNAIVTAAWDSLRDDEKENYLEGLKTAFKENAIDNVILLNLIPIAKDVVSFFDGYDATSYIYDGLESLVQTITSDKKYVTNWITGEKQTKTPYGIGYQNAKAISQLTGIPVANVLREFKTLYNIVNDFWGGKDLVTTQDKANKIAKTKESNRLKEVFATNDLSSMKAEITNTYNNALQSGKSEADAWKASRDMLKEQYLVMIAEHPEDKAAINNRFKTLLKYTKQSDGKGGMRDLTDKEIANRIEGWMSAAE